MNEKFLTPGIAKSLLETYRAFEAHPDDIAIASLPKEQFLEFLKEVGLYFFEEDEIEKIIESLEKIADKETVLTEEQAVIPQNLQELVAAYEKWLEDRENYKIMPSEAGRVSQEVDAARFGASLQQYKEQKQTEKIIEDIPQRRMFPSVRPNRQVEVGSSIPPRPPSLLYLYYRPATWTTLFLNNFSVPFGKESLANQKILEQALERFLQENKNLAQNLPLVQALRKNIETGRLLEERAERVYFDTEQTPETEQKLEAQGFDLLRLEFDEASQKLEAAKPTISAAAPVLPASEVVPKVSMQITSAVSKQTGNLLKNLFSKAAIALRQLFVNPGLGWLRLPLAAILGIGAVSPVGLPLQLLMGTGAIGLGLAQVRHSPGIFSLIRWQWIGQGAATTSRLLIGLTGAGIGKNIAIPLALVLGGTLLLLVFGTFFLSSNPQGIFLKEGVLGLEENYESEFIGLEKTVSPTSLANAPVTANFNITITAKKNKLTNIAVKDHFSVYSSKGNPTPPSATLPTIKDSLVVGETTNISLSVELGQEFQDSIITNTVEVTADVENGPQGEKVTRSASIQIGQTPTSCFVFNDNWPTENRTLVMQAIGHMSQASGFMGKLCGGGGGINLQRSFSDPGWSGEVINTNTIVFYNRSFTSSEQMKYVLAHETGHVFAWRNTQTFREFLHIVNPQEPGYEGYIPTYPSRLGDQLSKTERQSEDFAETIGVYIVWRAVPYLSGYNLSVIRDTYTKHFSFAKNNIFDGFEF